MKLKEKKCKPALETGKMCIGSTSSDWASSSSFSFYKRKARSKRYKIQVHRLNRRKRSGENSGADMKEKNLKLYMENVTIFHENEKLRMKANLLHQENLSLMSEFQKKKLSSAPLFNVNLNKKIYFDGWKEIMVQSVVHYGVAVEGYYHRFCRVYPCKSIK